MVDYSTCSWKYRASTSCLQNFSTPFLYITDKSRLQPLSLNKLGNLFSLDFDWIDAGVLC